ncbi:fibronectin type III domain-containing protein, partial [Myroides sp. C15-4]|uniref:fibronectin type III domain-containing protein n=1 Tax=Myroides sp. C15-4 TaxID=3400532 RepID=UPI003D2F5961
MKRMTVLFFFLLSICITYGQEVEIGIGTEADRQPLSSHFGYSRSAALYTSEEIDQTGFINKLAWDIGVIKGARPVKIYLKEVESTALIGGLWETFTEGATLVFDDLFTPTTVGYNTLNFNRSFPYTDGTKNLLVLVETNFEGGGNSDGFDGLEIKASTATNMHFTVESDRSLPTSALTALTTRPNLKITFGAEMTCLPIRATLDSSTTTSVSFTISESETTAGIAYEVRTQGEAGSGATGLALAGTITDISTMPLVIDGLTASTAYKLYVRATCGAEDVSMFSDEMAFTTEQIAATLPFTDNFEGNANWTLGTGSNNKWFIGTAIHNGGTKSLYISEDEGVNNSYNVNGRMVTHAYRDLAIPEDVGDILVSFDWRCVGEGETTKYDYFRIWLVPTSFNPIIDEQITEATDRFQLGSDFNLNPDFVRASFEQNVAAFSGENMRLVFEWRQDVSGGTQPPAAIDNVEVVELTCSAVQDVEVDAITVSSAAISWTAVEGQDTYEVYHATTNQYPEDTATGTVTSENPYTIEGLTASTSYTVWVRTVCDETEKSAWKQVSFETKQIPATLPYIEDFEGTYAWNAASNSVNKWVVGTAVHNGGTSSLYISQDNGATNTYNFDALTTAHAYRDIIIPAETVEVAVNFDWRCIGEGGTWDYFRVWVVPATFTPSPGTQITAAEDRIQLGRTEFNANPNFIREQLIQNVTTYAGETMRLVFEWKQDGSGGNNPPAAIDNLEVSAITCPAPTNVQVDRVTESSAVISWPAVQGQDNYEVYYSTTNTEPGDTVTGSVTTTDNPYTIDGLESNTTYYAWVRTICSDTDKSFWKSVLIITGQIPGELTYEDDFEGDNNWSLVSNSDNKWVVGTAVNNGGTQSLYVTKDNGVTNSYNNSTTTVAHAYRDIAIPAGTIEGSLSFDWRAVGEGTTTKFDYLSVWLVPTTYLPLAGERILEDTERIEVGEGYNLQEDFTTVLESLDLTSFAGQTLRLVFQWRNDGSSGDDPAAAVDNVKLKVETCPAVTGLSACIGSDRINYGWDSQEGMTRWEIAFSTIDGAEPAPDSIEIVEEPNYSATGLTVNTTYYFYVRNVCGPDNVSMWKKINVKTSSTSILDAEPFCAGPEGIIFPNNNRENTSEQYPLGQGLQIACLSSAPYPVWYFLKIDQDGDLVFDIIQNTAFDANGDEVGTGLDVDFVAFGPFDTLDQACAESVLGPCPPGVDCPNNTTDQSAYPAGNIVDCSYDSDPVESLTINNAVRGQIYAVLITNYNGGEGFIKLAQRNVEEVGAGTTDCKFLCEVDLGPDQYLCPGTNSFEIKANISAAGSTEDMEYTWFKDGEMMDPAVFNTNRLTVTETGTYRVRVEKDLCEENPEDEVYIKFYDEIELRLPEKLELCDVDNVGYADFEVKRIVEEALAAHAEPETLVHA